MPTSTTSPGEGSLPTTSSSTLTWPDSARCTTHRMLASLCHDALTPVCLVWAQALQGSVTAGFTSGGVGMSGM
ncbi:hypothetical protein GCM10009599_21990 [Luteococcus peritonei]